MSGRGAVVQVPFRCRMIARLHADHESSIPTVRMTLADSSAIASVRGVAGSIDFLSGFLREHEETARTARAWLDER